ncbi:MAG: hypothetical protein ABSE73_12760 [Planctomycetota bacterium]
MNAELHTALSTAALRPLALALDTEIQQDGAGNPVVRGLHGTIRPDGDGFTVTITTDTRKGATRADGLLHGVARLCWRDVDGRTSRFILPSLPTAEQAEVLRRVIGLKPKGRRARA